MRQTHTRLLHFNIYLFDMNNSDIVFIFIFYYFFGTYTMVYGH